MTHEPRHGPIHRPTLNDFVFEGEEVPLLLRKRVLAAIGLGFLALAAAYIGSSEYFGVSYSLDAEPFQRWVEKWGPLGPLVFILAMALSVLFAPIPNVPIFIAAGLAWGPVIGSAYSMAGMMLGSTMAFYTARAIGRRHIGRLIGRKAAARVDNLVETMGGRVVFWARMIPIVNFDWVSFVAGVTSIRFGPFFVYSFFGMLTPTIVAVIAGDQLGKDSRVTLAILGLWVAAIIASGAFFWYRHSRRVRLALRRASDESHSEFGTG